jgi:hypothetical protein
MSYSLFYNFTSALVLGPACPAGSRPGRGFEAPCPRPPPGGAGAPRQTRPGAVSGLLRPCFLVRGGAKTAARCGSSRWQVARVIFKGKCKEPASHWNSKRPVMGRPGVVRERGLAALGRRRIVRKDRAATSQDGRRSPRRPSRCDTARWGTHV